MEKITALRSQLAPGEECATELVLRYPCSGVRKERSWPDLSASSQGQASGRRRLPHRAGQAGRPDRVRPARPPLLRLRPSQGLVVLPRRRRQRRPDPGGPRRPLQGDPRLPHRSRVELPQLRGAVHHAPDHHGGEDGHAQQARAAEPVRLVLLDARRRRATASRRSTRCCPGRRVHDPVNQVISSEELRCARRLPVDRAVGARVARPVALPRRPLLRAGRRARRLRHEDGRQRAAARQAQGRRAPRVAQRPELTPRPRSGRRCAAVSIAASARERQDRERDHGVVHRRGAGDQRVEDLVVAEDRGDGVRAARSRR